MKQKMETKKAGKSGMQAADGWQANDPGKKGCDGAGADAGVYKAMQYARDGGDAIEAEGNAASNYLRF